MQDSDANLVQQTLSGDRGAFGDLVERYTRLVHGVVLELVRDPDVAEDLVQDVLTRAYQELSALRRPRQFGSWLRSIATNTTHDWLRHRQVHLRVGSSQGWAPAAPMVRPDEALESQEMAAALWEGLDNLAPEHRRVLVLRYLEQCSLREIARFLGLSVATVRWRLRRAQDRLKSEVTTLLYSRASQGLKSRRQLRDKAMSVLPLVVYTRPVPHGWLVHWGRRVGLVLLVGSLGGGLGMVGLHRWEEAGGAGMRQDLTGGFRVRRADMELPTISVTQTPQRPQAGERLRLEVAGFQPGEGESAYLHYITDLDAPVNDLDEPLDRVVEMRPAGEAWIAELTIPATASDVFYYVDDDGDPLRCDLDDPLAGWREDRQRYSSAQMVYDGAGRPVRGAELGMGEWAAAQERPGEDVLAHYQRELSLYPDHWDVYRRRWARMQWTDQISTGFDRVQREKEALLQRYPDNPDLAQMVINRWDTGRLRAFAARFPEHEKAAGAAYRATLRPFDDLEGRAVALRRFLRDFPRSPYTDDAHRDLLHMYDRIDRGRGKALADSLIDGDLVPYFDLEQELAAEQIQWSSNWEGALPEAKAYSLRFKWHMEEGDTTAAVLLARRLAASGLRDPIPFVSIGRQLVDTGDHRDVAVDLLQSGLRWLTEEHMLRLPTFTINPRWSIFSRESMRSYRRGEVLAWRVKCLHALGEIYLGQGDYRAAVLRLREAAELQRELTRGEPEQDIYMKLGEVREKLGDCAGAIDAYMDVVRVNYRHSGAEDALQRLLRGKCGRRETLGELLATTYTEAPGFRAVDVSGDSLGLSDFRGSVVAMYYGGCQWSENRANELDVLAGWHDRFHSAGLRVIYLGVPGLIFPGNGEPPLDTRDQMTEAVRERGYSFPVAFEDDPMGRSKYGPLTRGGRCLFLIDRMGRLRMRQARAWDEDEIESQNREAVGLLEQLLAEPVSSGSLAPRVAEAQGADGVGGGPEQPAAVAR